MELTLKQVLSLLWKRWLVLILAAVIGGAAMLFYTVVCVDPVYESTSMLYVSNKQDGNPGSVTSADLTVARNLISTYTVILKSSPVLEKVIENTGLDYSEAQLNSMISASSVNNTEIFRVTVSCTNPEHARMIAEALATYGAPQIVEIVSAGSAKIVEHAKLPENAASPNPMRNALLGAVVCFLLAAVVVVLFEIFDVRLKDVPAAAKELDIPLLGTVEDYSDSLNAGKGGRK